MHHASPVRGCAAWTIRYRTGSRRLRLGEAMSIFARSTRAPFGNSPAAHPLEEVQVLLDRPIPPGALATRLGERAAMLADLVGREVVDVGLAGPDEVDRPLVELAEVIRGVVEVLAPVEAQPAHVRLDGVDVRLLLLDRVGVVEPQVAVAAELLRDAEVEADRLGVTDVEVAVGLRREAGDDRRAPALAQVRGHDVANEIGPLRRRWGLDAHGGRPRRGLGGVCPPDTPGASVRRFYQGAAHA